MKPLVISRSYLLEKSATGQIQRFFWEDLYNHGYSPTIICSKVNKNERTKEHLNSSVISTFDSQSIKQLFRIIKHTIFADIDKIPDIFYYSWAKISAIRRAKREVLKGSYDYIESIQLPCSSHLVALEAKKVSGLPWIASFYDPWYDNPLRPIKRPVLREKDKRLEALVANNADAIIHTNQAIYDEWVERYGEAINKKMYVLPLVFNTPQREDNNEAKVLDVGEKFIISHIGKLYLDRTSVDFLMAVRLLLTQYPELKKRLIINYVGTVTPQDVDFVNKNDLESVVNYAGFLNESECNKYYEQSDLFLAIDAKTARNIFFPSKIMKYFYYGKPILGITPQDSALSYELEKSHNFCFTHDDCQGIADFLYCAILKDGYLKGIDTEYWRRFTMDIVRPQYEEIVNKVLTR